MQRQVGGSLKSDAPVIRRSASIACALLVALLLATSGVTRAEDVEWPGPSVDLKHGPVEVSHNKRFLMHRDGTPFLYLADTAWELVFYLNREDTEKYLEDRRRKGFTAIQLTVNNDVDAWDFPNAYGQRPFIDSGPTKPNEEFWRHVDWVIDRAAEKGMYVGLLPTWGRWVNDYDWDGVKLWPDGKYFQRSNALGYGEFIGRRYKNKSHIIWILGGDRRARGAETKEIWRLMAKGIAVGVTGREDYSKVLMTFHPAGPGNSAEDLHKDEWLDFNMIQTGHHEDSDKSYVLTEDAYRRTPAKPVCNGEPPYEDHPLGTRHGDDYDVRQHAYWSLFAGAHGHTYGNHAIWQFNRPGSIRNWEARTYWYDALDSRGAWDMMHVRRLMFSRLFFSRVPDQTLIAGGQGAGADHIRATRGDDYLFVYVPTGKNVILKMGVISGKRVRGWWFDPRTGEAISIGYFPNTGTREFDPPGAVGRGHDWVLVLDDAAQHYPAPGKPLINSERKKA